MNKTLPKTIVFVFPLLLLSTTVLSQERTTERASEPAQQAITERARAKAEAVQRHMDTVVYDKYTPPPVSSNLYVYVFSQIISNPNISATIPREDMVIIEGLPSHIDEQFLSYDKSELAKFCNKLSSAQSNIPAAALEFADIRDRSEERKMAHYEQVLNRLGDTTRLKIESMLNALTSRMNFTRSDIDIFSLANENIEFATELLHDGCHRFEADLGSKVLERKSLKEEVLNPSRYMNIQKDKK